MYMYICVEVLIYFTFHSGFIDELTALTKTYSKTLLFVYGVRHNTLINRLPSLRVNANIVNPNTDNIQIAKEIV